MDQKFYSKTSRRGLIISLLLILLFVVTVDLFPHAFVNIPAFLKILIIVSLGCAPHPIQYWALLKSNLTSFHGNSLFFFLVKFNPNGLGLYVPKTSIGLASLARNDWVTTILYTGLFLRPNLASLILTKPFVIIVSLIVLSHSNFEIHNLRRGVSFSLQAVLLQFFVFDSKIWVFSVTCNFGLKKNLKFQHCNENFKINLKLISSHLIAF